MNAREVKSLLKENGIETSNVRVSVGGNLSTSIDVKLLDPKLDSDKIKSIISEKYESIDTDQASGEILSGGNTFIFVEYEYELFSQVAEELRSTVEPFLDRCTGSWSLQALVSHYVDTVSVEYNKQMTKRGIEKAFRKFFDEGNRISGLVVDEYRF